MVTVERKSDEVGVHVAYMQMAVGGVSRLTCPSCFGCWCQPKQEDAKKGAVSDETKQKKGEEERRKDQKERQDDERFCSRTFQPFA